MIGYLLTSPLGFLVWIIALIVAITIHEFAHAHTADRLGDPTPRIQGRLTLNPVAHLDPFGTLMLLLFRFGWGKPVQFDPFNLENPKRDSALISLAGPASNIFLAILLAILLRISDAFSFAFLTFNFLLQPIIVLNVILAIFNLIPIHPLDGFKIVGGFLPHDKYLEWQELRPYGIFILLLLLLPFGSSKPLIANLIGPPIDFLLSIFLPQTTL